MKDQCLYCKMPETFTALLLMQHTDEWTHLMSGQKSATILFTCESPPSGVFWKISDRHHRSPLIILAFHISDMYQNHLKYLIKSTPTFFMFRFCESFMRSVLVCWYILYNMLDCYSEHFFFSCSSEVKDSSLHIYVFKKIYGFIIYKVSLGRCS